MLYVDKLRLLCLTGDLIRFFLVGNNAAINLFIPGNLYSLPSRMTFPISYQLQNGTKVEVNPNKGGDRFVFDLFHNNIMFDSFTWTPEANVRAVDIGISDSQSLEGHYLEALSLFRKMK